MEPTGSTSADESPPGLSTTPVGSRKSLLNASAAGAAFLVLVQVLSRLLTFVMNQLLIRHLSPAILGQAAQLELYLMTILFFSRESLRMALQRQAEASEGTIDGAKDGDSMKSDHYKDKIIEGTTRGQAQTVVNSSYLAVPIGFMVIAALYLLQIGYTYVWPSASGQASSGYFRLSMGIYAIASLLELLSEPGFAVAQQRLLYGLRAGCESMAVISNCAVTLAVTLLASKYVKSTVVEADGGVEGDLETLPFAIGQVVFSLCLVIGYPLRLGKIAKLDGWSLLPKKIHSRTGHGYYLHQPTISVAQTMWFQSIVKHLLTQGDSILVTRLATTYEQGIYALAANYGSLIARLLFKPIEETSRNLLSKLLNTDDIDDRKPGEKGGIKEKKNGSGGTKAPTSESIAEALTILHLILRFYIILSILIVTLGPILAPLALRKVAGSRWADSPAAITLSNYCYYIPLLAINGITEAFVQSVATTQDLKRQSMWMLCFSGVFGASSWGFVKFLGLGADGLVWANCVNMGMRILWSVSFIRKYFTRVGDGKRGPEVESIMPGRLLVTIAVGVGAIARRVVGERGVLADYVKGSGLAGVVGVVCLYSERQFFMECYRLFKRARKA
ncbi:Oligosaccharide translocation protein rft1 [Orbilia oligospora]|uniref:Man(5)GlcNAc(2)-PP-dolichol translocation protein RFT1 n=1 Tax=Orbilia oligospora TaxID=2813651 RepID=A0A7C8PB73_ORBOL|nr:Oligosaccharide translocation protein rft1 [Orbilia oligospora]KAF3162727.1 Oligosaccharide translocation protein rft1 [Orbilia oligospora]KAF3235773.1 Oligosaccharide translocation protein rft1 [Orbilia oligospora]KAF3258823.1 Oligosaccharide translocation protein rft1 [Orbilia oligospora]KAF3294135.1 Oligosaccharide translocation protein rft1 [Orbilia oligospora]